MPETTMKEEADYKLPLDTLFPAILAAVTEKEIPYKDKPGSFTKWEWEFQITEGDYAGLRAWGDTEDRLTNRSNNKVRQWAETLRGAEFELGEGLNTDDLLGLPCVITVDNVEHKKANGEIAYLTPVKDVFPADAVAQTDEPPF